MKNKIIVTILALLWVPALVIAQQNDKSELENEKKALQSEMKELQSMYDQVKGQKKQSLGQLNLLKRKIALQERYINTINRDLKLIDDDIYTSNLEIYRLQKQLDTLKAQYARSVVYAYKNRTSFDYVNFIFSANNFNDAVRRVAYLKSYRAYREKQVENIYNTQDLIAKRQQQQLVRKKEKNETLASQSKEREALNGQRKEKDEVVSKLKSQEKDLQKQLAARKKRNRDLQNALDAIVRREIEAAKKEEAARRAAAKKAADEEKRNTATTTPGRTVTPTPPPATAEKKPASYLELNARDVALGADFAANKGKLPWPVDKGVVVIPFGIYTIEGIGGGKLQDNSPGITIATQSAGAQVKAVFNGKVLAVHNMGDVAAVVIQHGRYITTYSNLSSVSVSKGTDVKTGQVLGRAGESEDGAAGQVNFILMIDDKNVNPSTWLRRAN